jgi:CheY-like chemotaxis protein
MTDQPCPKIVAIIEDDLGIRDSIAGVLEDEGYRVVAADHGRDALDRLERETEAPCVILLDLMMPVMDGWAFREAQKRHPVLAPVPVIIMTADTKAKDKADELGARVHMGKPLDLDALLQAIQQYC